MLHNILTVPIADIQSKQPFQHCVQRFFFSNLLWIQYTIYYLFDCAEYMHKTYPLVFTPPFAKGGASHYTTRP
jgi:hypothetical protein